MAALVLYPFTVDERVDVISFVLVDISKSYSLSPPTLLASIKDFKFNNGPELPNTLMRYELVVKAFAEN